MNCGVPTQVVSEEKNSNTLPKDHSCDTLVKKVAAFNSCLKSLPLAEEISKQHITVSILWLLVFMLINISNKKAKAKKGKLQNVNF